MNRMTAGHEDISVMVVEDHPLFCEALTMTLREGFSVQSVTARPTLEAATEALSNGENPDVIILDLNLPDVTGMEGLIRMKALRPDTPVIVVSSLSDNRIVNSVLQNGGAGFVSKDSPRDEIIAAFRTVWSGGSYTPESFVAIDDGAARDSENFSRRLADLTPQQGRILAAICEGKLNKQIAFDLSIAEATVKAHVTAILRKLGVQSRTQAVLLAQNVKFAAILNDTRDVQ